MFKRKGEHIDPVALTEYLDGRLTVGKRERVELHLEGCSRCSEELESLRHAVGLLRQAPMLAPRRVFTLAGAPPAVLVPRRVMVPAWAYGAVASAAVVLFAILISADLGGVLERKVPLSATSQAASGAASEPTPSPQGPAGPASPQAEGAPGAGDGEASTPSDAGTVEAGLAAAEDTALKFEAEAEPDAGQRSDQGRGAMDEEESEEEQAAPRPPHGTPSPDESRSAAVAGAPAPPVPEEDEGQHGEERATLSEKVDVEVVRATPTPVPTASPPPKAEDGQQGQERATLSERVDIEVVRAPVPGAGGTSIFWRVLEGVLGAAALLLVATFLWRGRRLRGRINA